MCLSRVLFQRCTWNDIVRNGCFLLRAWWRFRACTTGIVEPVLAIESTADAFVQVAFVRTSHGSGLCVAIQTELWTFPTYPGGARPREKSLIRNGVGQRPIPSTKWRWSGGKMLVRRNAQSTRGDTLAGKCIYFCLRRAKAIRQKHQEFRSFCGLTEPIALPIALSSKKNNHGAEERHYDGEWSDKFKWRCCKSLQ